MKTQVYLPGLAVLLISSAFIAAGGGSFTDGKIKADFKTKDGMFDGAYVSYYPNGVKKAEGKFVHNTRYGKWSVWDSTGKLIVQRNYKNLFEYEQQFPEFRSKTTIKPIYTVTRNEANVYGYFNFEKKDIVVSRRLWRYIPVAEESAIFKGDVFFNSLMDSALAGKIPAYDPVSDELTKKMDLAILDRYTDTLRGKILGYRIKEDWFFDKSRETAESRIIGICPVMRSVYNLQDSVDVCWFYFPQLRNTMNAIKLENVKHGSEIRTLDDLFFFRYFPGVVYKETNIKNLELREYCAPETLGHAQQRIEIELIEREHDLWVKYSK
jgi:hypothetical protein